MYCEFTMRWQIFSCGIFALTAALGQAQSYPAKPVRFIVPYPPGGATDIIARSISGKLGAALGQQFVVDNRAGGGQKIGTALAAKSPADGHTMLLVSVTHSINPALDAKLPYDSVKDFVPVTLIASSPNAVVLHPSVPAKSLHDLIALARSRPNQLIYGSGGNGSPPHLTAELFKSLTGTRMTHVPFKGSAPSVIALVGGQVDLSFSTVAITLPQIQAGRVRAIAVTSPKRSAALPNLPTLREAGPANMADFESQQWFALFGPAALPRETITRLNGEIMRWMESAEVRTRLSAEGAEPGQLTLEQFAAFIRSDATRWVKVVKASGATAD